MFLNLRSGSLRRRWDKIKGCATATMLTNCHSCANNGRILNIRKRIPKFDVNEARSAPLIIKTIGFLIRTTDHTYNIY